MIPALTFRCGHFSGLLKTVFPVAGSLVMHHAGESLTPIHNSVLIGSVHGAVGELSGTLECLSVCLSLCLWVSTDRKCTQSSG